MISLPAYLLILGALCGERLFELKLAWRNARDALARGAIETGQRHYRVMVVMHALFIVSCAVEAIVVDRPPPRVISALAIAGALLAQVLRYWSVIALGRRWNTRIIVLPEIEPVTRGPYRFIRHPNYVAVAIEVAAVPIIYGCWLTAIAFSLANVAMMAVRIPAEERALGRSYRGVFAARPRFLPGSRI